MNARQVNSSAPTDGVPTQSSYDQAGVEHACRALFGEWLDLDDTLHRHSIALRRPEHTAYLMAGLGGLSEAYCSLDASRPWLCYWILHSKEILSPGTVRAAPQPLPLTRRAGAARPHAAHVATTHPPHRPSPVPPQIPEGLVDHIVAFLASCQHRLDGGFGGGPYPGQAAHLAPTYAAVNALVTLGTEEAFRAVDRRLLYRFLLAMKQPSGGFCMHRDGECDVRGAYTAVAVASLCNVLDARLREGLAAWIATCQTYEGGIGATPGEEAHGGYTFCGLAAMVLLGEAPRLRLHQLAHWLAGRQMGAEGGFQGRTNKLVDGCYSFWQGGSFPLLHATLAERGELPPGGQQSLLSAEALLDYVMVCCQCAHGGLRDKPGKGRDYYHTCYCLSGASVAATIIRGGGGTAPPADDGAGGIAPPEIPAEWTATALVNPVYNVAADKVEKALAYFNAQPMPPP